jgi:LysM repeat protein
VVRLSHLLFGATLAVTTLGLPGLAAAQQSSDRDYVVVEGDTLSGIAANTGIPLDDLLAANGLGLGSVIMPGQVLALPDARPVASGAVYTVVAGDTLSGIAARSGVSLDALLALNGLSVTSLITPGTSLRLPAGAIAASSSGSAAPAATGGAYTVVAGDTLSTIADGHGVSLSALLAVNSLSASSLITPGMQLSLPAGASASSGSSSGSAAVAATNTPVDRVLAFALAQVGKPYVFFTKGPTTFDCSGLTLAAYAQIGVDLVHHAATQAQQGRAVDFWNDSIQTGDLVFLDGDWDGTIDHVGIALSATMWVQASQSHDTVLTGSLPSKSVIIAVRRFVG